ncbi:caspase family protein, partial [Mariniblastus sp.]|nr:caspase family protein [Mariniblastus sp.]
MNLTKLEYPEADAQAVADALEKFDYRVVKLLGDAASAKNVGQALGAIAKKGDDRGVVLIGLFGHGVQYGEDAYFCPYDTALRFVTDGRGNKVRDGGGTPKLEPDPESTISMRSVLDALTACGAGNRILLADCCREDPSRARGRAFGSKLKVSDLPSGTAALFACSANEQAFEHRDWGHGAFTLELLERLKDADHELTANSLSADLYRAVGKRVREKTNGRDSQSVNPIINGIVDLKLDSNVKANLFTVEASAAQLRAQASQLLREAEDEIAEFGQDHLLPNLSVAYLKLGDLKNAERLANEADLRYSKLSEYNPTFATHVASCYGMLWKMTGAENVRDSYLTLVDKTVSSQLESKGNSDSYRNIREALNNEFRDAKALQFGDQWLEFWHEDSVSNFSSAVLAIEQAINRKHEYRAVPVLIQHADKFLQTARRIKLIQLREKVRDDVSRLVIASFLNDEPTVISLRKSTSAYAHRPYWVVPFILSDNVDTVFGIEK